MLELERVEWEEEDLREAVAQNGVVVTPLMKECIAFCVMRCVAEYCRLEDGII